MASNNNDLQINQNSYLAFEATSLKQLIKERLDTGGQFSDQNYEGSNISSLIDIIAYAFHTQMFYLNKTSTESMFSEAQIYENMSRVVKLLDYKPVGNQTATLTFSVTAQPLSEGPTYTIPRYSFFRINNVAYAFNSDITFTKTTSGVEVLDSIGEQNLLYQGRFQEYPIQTAIGEDNEVVFLTPGDDIIIDHFNIHVYVKDATTGNWLQWIQTPSLYLESATDTKFELRLNEKKHYEIKFGNDINGKKLNEGDDVAIYYLESSGANGEIGVGREGEAGVLTGKKATLFQTVQFNEILPDLLPTGTSVIAQDNLSQLQFTNTSASTKFSTPETVDSIRNNAPTLFRSQYRLVTPSDYENFVQTNYANIINDVKVFNNWEFLSGHIKYLYTIGLRHPNEDSRVFFNQVNFADACNFNNIYLYAVPKTEVIYSQRAQNFLTPAQKSLIVSGIRDQKTILSEIVVQDPVYIAASVGVAPAASSPTLADLALSELTINLDVNAKIDEVFIIDSIRNVFATYFKPANVTLGQTVDISSLNNQILSIKSIKSVSTTRTDTGLSIEGLSLILWNPVYPDADINAYTQNIQLDDFKFLFLYNIDDIMSRVVINTVAKKQQQIEY